jgi:lysophospholipase L1-like esterase
VLVVLVGACPVLAQRRIVCLGDSITDGCTYPQILAQALREAGKAGPIFICSGVASDTAAQMAARLERTVLNFKPDVVTFSAGTNDSLRGVSAEQYERSLRAIARKVKAAGARMVLLTPCIINPAESKDPKARQASAAKARAAEALVGEYLKAIRTVAREEGWPVAENNALMRQARAAGKQVMTADGIHPNYFGQSLMARAILDALNSKDVPLPRTFAPRLFPGVIRTWKMRPAPLDAKQRPQVLDEKTVKELKPDGTWKTITLPEPAPAEKPTAEDWLEQERRNGFALRLDKSVSKGPIQAVAVLEEKKGRRVFINTGIGVATVWLNGKKIYTQGSAWTGYHAGKERLPVELKEGKNVLVVEIQGDHFFLSVTDKLVWEEALR